MPNLPKLSLYIHMPWCIKKCPYCDFNSFVSQTQIPEENYIRHLLNDLSNDISLISERKIDNIFIGGGTPSLFSEKSIQLLLEGVHTRLYVSPFAEITIEANPGTMEINRFDGYQASGVNRISIGIQSFNQKSLQHIDRTYYSNNAIQAIILANTLGLNSFNLDLMHGLPHQTKKEALRDLQVAINLNVPHISWYQLTIEPNTLFSRCRPSLPNEDDLWDIFQKGDQLLHAAGYEQYEISSYSRQGHYCAHNLNYWRFGDYLGIGCGAHGKITQLNGSIIRTEKTKHPRKFMSGCYLYKLSEVCDHDKPFEFFINRFRLLEPIPKNEYRSYTGLLEHSIRAPLDILITKGYLIETDNFWQTTQKGRLFLNSMLEVFLSK
ncbi:Oxygen-independent coproporphyrinogen-III oxidase-like protein YggW [Candidatus Erwinia haradaeae]|uniref:Heme chaperone HemW n=1 Tax=Candidatus Erwinia haradaeae TaxID=1922217 RepID=A0A451D0C4_9GAMM|nr:radical SAM family heme chaperone HemW [Candidatus Erwinia haradaeae]VFP79005.1 Oxygen-independent coproporphyrinogen-III oxidase-like protein YggW [Candidatus Erwinia haradaeae]